MRKSDKHYAWLLRGRLKGWLEGIAFGESDKLRIEREDCKFLLACGWQTPTPGVVKEVHCTYWRIRSDAMHYITVCLRGNAKQRRQQRRAMTRFLAAEQDRTQAQFNDPSGLQRYQREFLGGKPRQTFSQKIVDEMGPIDLTQIDTHGGMATVTPVRVETDEEWADRVDGGNVYRGPL